MTRTFFPMTLYAADGTPCSAGNVYAASPQAARSMLEADPRLRGFRIVVREDEFFTNCDVPEGGVTWSALHPPPRSWWGLPLG